MTITHKCDSTERQINEIMFLNAALQSQIEETKIKIGIAKAERKFLLNKLLNYEKESPEEVFNCNIGNIVSSSSNSGGANGILQQVLSRKQLTNKNQSNSNCVYQPSTPINP